MMVHKVNYTKSSKPLSLALLCFARAYLIRDAIAKAGPFSASEDNSQSIEILGPSGLCNQPQSQ
jgi:hypothetical protein